VGRALTRELEGALRSALAGEIRFDEYTRHLYSTDASLYAIEPLGVAYPRNAHAPGFKTIRAERVGVSVRQTWERYSWLS